MAGEHAGPGLEQEKDLVTEAREQFDVDLNNDHAVLSKMHQLQTDTNKVLKLADLWKRHVDQQEAA